MPFFTYTVKNEIFENYRNLDVKKFQKFLYDIEDLNISKKAILVEDVNNSLLNKILKTQNYLSKTVFKRSKNFRDKSVASETYKFLIKISKKYEK